jgi:UDP-N-acetylmuramate dehydrogenase
MIQTNVLLKDYSNYKIGGPASYFLEAKTKDELLEGIKDWQEICKDLSDNERQVFVLGGGTNILFSDEGFKGLVIKISLNLISLVDDKISVGAGTLFSEVTEFCIENSLSGFEWAGGMPGTVGGAVRGNAGAFGGETKDNIASVTSLNLDTFDVIQRSNKECEFSYRSSIFKTKALNEIVISAEFIVKKGERNEIEKKIREEQEFRKTKHPLENPNAGSVFKNVPVENIPLAHKDELSGYIKNDPFPVVPAAKIIFLTGLKGKTVGQAAVSQKHTNFIINLGDATAKDIKDLIEVIKSEVKQKYDINLETEIMIL